MPIRAQLINEIEATLGSVIHPSLNTFSAANDIYEAYLFTIIIQAARAEGANISYKCINGGVSNPFIFRTSPGYINSKTKNYGYVVIEFSGHPALELHMGIRVAGQSNVLHECDVCVIHQDEADICRNSNNQISPRSSKIIIGVEAKFYTTGLSLHLGRAFLGLTRDFSANELFFVINRESHSNEKLLAFKKQKWEHKIIPSEQNCVNRLKHSFQTAFKNFKAKTR